jgi:hypothetical protein
MLSNLYSEYNIAKNCTPVSPVADGIPQYNHAGCITGYVVKNSSTGVHYYTGPKEDGTEIYDKFGNITGILEGTGADRVYLTGAGLSGNVQFYGAGSVSAYDMGIPTYNAAGDITGTIVGQANADKVMYTPEGVNMDGYETITDSNGNVIGFANATNGVTENRSYDYYMRNIGVQEGM